MSVLTKNILKNNTIKNIINYRSTHNASYIYLNEEYNDLVMKYDNIIKENNRLICKNDDLMREISLLKKENDKLYIQNSMDEIKMSDLRSRYYFELYK